MGFNFTNKLPLSQKQKDAAVMTALLKHHGSKFYDYPIEARQNLREEKYAELFLDKPAKTITQQEHDAAFRALGVDQAPVDINGAAYTVEQSTPGTGLVKFKPEDLAPEAAKMGEYIPAGDDSRAASLAKEILDAKEAEKETFSLDVVLNAKQLLAVEYAIAGKCFVYTGAAGTGKTTGCREIAKALVKCGKLRTHDFKIRGGGGRWWGPSFAAVAYTNRAANNMGKALHKDPELAKTMTGNILTVHALLEYEPVFFPREDGTTGMRFEPKRTASNPLKITHLVIEESSMLGIDLWLKLFEALPAGCQIIFVGDINQLPPVFSKAILNYALITLPVVELTEVYRQALDSPIIANAHRCLKGEKLVNEAPHFRLIQKKELTKIPSESLCVNTLVNSLKKWNDEQIAGTEELVYDPEQDIVLCPYGKEGKHPGAQASSTVLNNHIAQFLGSKRNAMVYEVLAGMRKLYLAVGDRVMVDKQDGYITRIVHNGNYVGRAPKAASTELTRFGVRVMGAAAIKDDEDFELSIEGYENLDVSKILDEDDDAKKRASSHIVDVLMDDGRTKSLDSAGEFSDNWFSLGYALTVHKAQGCEWRKVIILIHRNHATLLNRELMYTAITRAREYCVIVDLCNMVDKAIANQKIKGNSVEEKIEWFNSEVNLAEPVPVVP